MNIEQSQARKSHFTSSRRHRNESHDPVCGHWLGHNVILRRYLFVFTSLRIISLIKLSRVKHDPRLSHLRPGADVNNLITNHAPTQRKMKLMRTRWIKQSFQLYDNVIDRLIKHKIGIKLINRIGGDFLKYISCSLIYLLRNINVPRRANKLYKRKTFIATTVIYLDLDSDRTYL